MAIEADHYSVCVWKLQADPIVISMAEQMRGAPKETKAGWRYDNGFPKFGFMQAANAEYRKRGGVINGHVGAVATALLKLVGTS